LICPFIIVCVSSIIEAVSREATQRTMAKLYLIAALVAAVWCAAALAQVTEPYGARTTFDWGKYTAGQNNHQQDRHQDQHQENNGQQENGQDGGLMWQHRCGGGQWTCANAANMCVSLFQLCDGVQNCPGGEDEDATLCKHRLTRSGKAAVAVP